MFLQQDSAYLHKQLLLPLFVKPGPLRSLRPSERPGRQAEMGQLYALAVTGVKITRPAKANLQDCITQHFPLSTKTWQLRYILTAIPRLLRPGVEEADLALDVLGARQAQQRAGVAQAQQLQEARLEHAHSTCKSALKLHDARVQ